MTHVGWKTLNSSIRSKCSLYVEPWPWNLAVFSTVAIFLSLTFLIFFTSQEDTNVITAVTKTSEPAKVTITKVFDFAGEEIR